MQFGVVVARVDVSSAYHKEHPGHHTQNHHHLGLILFDGKTLLKAHSAEVEMIDHPAKDNEERA